MSSAMGMRRSGAFTHGEAFCLMIYQCTSCGHREVIWNSRDGVTPFCVSCVNCHSAADCCHTDFHLDQFAPLYQPAPGTRYFADMTKERAMGLATRNADMLVSMGRAKENDRNRLRDNLYRQYYGTGVSPDLLIKEG